MAALPDRMIPDEKRALRRELRAWRAALPADDRERAFSRALDLLLASPAWADARVVALVAALPSEPDLGPAVLAADRAGKIVALPVVAERHAPLTWRRHRPGDPLHPSSFGVPEPGPDAPTVPPGDLDLIVVPALAVDATGTRIGYGGGYYDRTLPLSPGALRVWVGLPPQVRTNLPREPFDVPVHAVVTPEGWRWTSASRPDRARG